MQVYGTCGRSARWYGDELAVIKGRRTSDKDKPVYPDNYCIQCVKEGRDLETCFHHHWEAT